MIFTAANSVRKVICCQLNPQPLVTCHLSLVTCPAAQHFSACQPVVHRQPVQRVGADVRRLGPAPTSKENSTSLPRLLLENAFNRSPPQRKITLDSFYPIVCEKPLIKSLVKVWLSVKEQKMRPFLSATSLLFLNHDGKPHPVEGVIMLLAGFFFIFCFDKWVIQRERHRPHSIAPKRSGKRVQHTVLQLIDFFVGLYFWRFRVQDEPFRKATETEKRTGACFMVLFPAAMALMLTHTQKVDAYVDSMTTGRHWIGWLYISFMAVIGGAAVFGLTVAPKIPLSVTVPAAVLSWLTMGWVIWTRHNV